MKIIVCGPPHSGKSIFLDLLRRKLPNNVYFTIRAHKDGEGNWANNQDQDVVQNVRIKEDYDQEYIQSICNEIKRSNHNVVLVDIGGKLRKDKIPLFECCDSFIIVSKDKDLAERWLYFGNKHIAQDVTDNTSRKIKCLAKITSIKDGDKSRITKNEGHYLEGEIEGLARGCERREYEIISALAKNILEEAKYSPHCTIDSNAVDYCSWAIDHGIVNESGNEWYTEKAPDLAAAVAATAVERKYCNIFGVRPNWASVIITDTIFKGDATDVSIYDGRKESYVNIRTILQADDDRQLVESMGLLYNIQAAEKEVFLDIAITQDIFTADDYEKVLLPRLEPDKILYISGRLPLWLLNAIVHSYKNDIVFVFQPGNNFICVRHNDIQALGQTKKRPDEIDTNLYFHQQKMRRDMKDYLKTGEYNSELFIGFSYFPGAEKRANTIISTFATELKEYGYEVLHIKSGDIIPSGSTAAGEQGEKERLLKESRARIELRKSLFNSGALMYGVADKISSFRKGHEIKAKIAYLIEPLTRSEEIDVLKRIYGKSVFFVSLGMSDESRARQLILDGEQEQDKLKKGQWPDFSKAYDNYEEEYEPYADKTIKAYELADFFIDMEPGSCSCDVSSYLQKEVARFVALLFGIPYVNPTFDEHAMFMAYCNAAHTSSLARQIGAVITRNNDILAVGTNECVQAGGGQYFTTRDGNGNYYDYEKGKDYKRGEDSNKKIIGEIKEKIYNKLKDLLKDDMLDEAEEILEKSKLYDLTEFGRANHAEMEALLCCARNGIPTLGATLYCTTFPCHNCAKHIVNAGIKEVVSVESYAKSHALDLFDDALTQNKATAEFAGKVILRQFSGVSARRYLDLFTINLGDGMTIKRKNDSDKVIVMDKDRKKWKFRFAQPALAYECLEKVAAECWQNSLVKKASSFIEL